MGSYRGFVTEMVTGYLAGKTVKAMFVDETYVPDYQAHSTIADIVAYEATGTGYTAGGYAVTATVVEFNGEVQIRLADVQIEGTMDLGGVVFYVVESGRLLGGETFVPPVAVDGNFTYKAATDGSVVFVTGD